MEALINPARLQNATLNNTQIVFDILRNQIAVYQKHEILHFLMCVENILVLLILMIISHQISMNSYGKTQKNTKLKS